MFFVHTRTFISTLVCTTLFFFAFTLSAEAATLFAAPTAQTVEVGDTFPVDLMVKSTDDLMNAVSMRLEYDSSIIEIVGFDDSEALIDFWVQNPTYGDGSAWFEGVSFDGYLGEGTVVATLLVEAKATGVSPVSVVAGSVLAHDGAGSTIATDYGSAQVTVVPATVDPTVPALPADSTLPPAPIITSLTHPSQTSWYTDTDARFSWQTVPGLEAVSVYFSDEATYDADLAQEQTVTYEWTETVPGEGTYYLYVRFKNSEGWGPASAYRVQVDMTPPEMLTVDVADTPCCVWQPGHFTIEGADALSGIARYDIYVDDEFVKSIAADSEESFVPNGLRSGSHVISVYAYDHAENVLEEHYIYYVPNWWVRYSSSINIALLALLAFSWLIIFVLLKRRKDDKEEEEEESEEIVVPVAATRKVASATKSKKKNKKKKR